MDSRGPLAAGLSIFVSLVSEREGIVVGERRDVDHQTSEFSKEELASIFAEEEKNEKEDVNAQVIHYHLKSLKHPHFRLILYFSI